MKVIINLIDVIKRAVKLCEFIIHNSICRCNLLLLNHLLIYLLLIAVIYSLKNIYMNYID